MKRYLTLLAGYIFIVTIGTAQEMEVLNLDSINSKEASPLDLMTDAEGITYLGLLGAELNRGLRSSFHQSIQGRLSGVQVSVASGSPNALANTLIRGVSSITQSGSPLIILDGFRLLSYPVSFDPINVGFGSRRLGSSLSFINPSDIAELRVIRGPEAAIYGARGANGVILINTVNRDIESNSIDYTTSVSYSLPSNRYELLTREGYLNAIERFGANPALLDFGASTDWQDVITRSSISYNHLLSAQKLWKQGWMRSAVGYQKNVGIIENSDLQRVYANVHGGLSSRDKRFSLSGAFMFSNVREELAPLSNNSGFRGDFIGAAYSGNPTWPTDPNFDNAGPQRNASNILTNIESIDQQQRWQFSIAPIYELLPKITLKAKLGYHISNENYESVAARGIRDIGLGAPGNGRGDFREVATRSGLAEFSINYSSDTDQSSFSFEGGYSHEYTDWNISNIQGWGFDSPSVGDMRGDLSDALQIIEDDLIDNYEQYGMSSELIGNTIFPGFFVNRLTPIFSTDIAPLRNDLRVASVFVDRQIDRSVDLTGGFAVANYEYEEKYQLSASLRAERSNQWLDQNLEFFPSTRMSWQLSKEDFVPKFFSNLNLSYGYGITGNRGNITEVGLGRDGAMFNSGRITNAGTMVIPGIINTSRDAIEIEKTREHDLTLSYGLLSNRLQGRISYYQRTTGNLLIQQISDLGTFSGFTNLEDGVMINDGLELELSYHHTGSAVRWSTGFNLAYNHNEFRDFEGQRRYGDVFGGGLTDANVQLLAEGQAVQSFYLREFQGFDIQGQSLFGEIDFRGTSLPSINTGLSLDLSFKNWGFSTMLYGQFGHHIYNNTANGYFVAGALTNTGNVTVDVPTSQESGTALAPASTRFLERGDFVRLDNVSISRSIVMRRPGFIKKLHLSLIAQNLLVLTNYSGLDPEVSNTQSPNEALNGIPSMGIDYATYPRAAIFTLSLNVEL